MESKTSYINTQASRLKELKYSFSPEDEKIELAIEMTSRANNPKVIGIFSSGGLSNNIISKMENEHSQIFKDKSYETVFEHFERSMIPLVSKKIVETEDEVNEVNITGISSTNQQEQITTAKPYYEEPSVETAADTYMDTAEEEDLIFEPDEPIDLEVTHEGLPEDEYLAQPPIRRDGEEYDHVPEQFRATEQEYESVTDSEDLEAESSTKPLTFRERVYRIFNELKRKLGLIKPRRIKPKREATTAADSIEELKPEQVSGVEHEVFEPTSEPELESKSKPEVATQALEAGIASVSSTPSPTASTASTAAQEVLELGNIHGTSPINAQKSTDPPHLQSMPGKGEVIKKFKNKDIIFIVTCLDDIYDIENSMVISELAKKNNILSVVIACLPRYFGKVENVYSANKVLQKLRLIAEIVILLPYYETIDFNLIPKMIQELLEVITKPGLINVDVADLKIIVKGGNVGIISFGSGTHATRHKDALFEALDSKLLNIDLGGVNKAMLNVTGSKDITLAEVEGLANQIKTRINPEARFILGTTIDISLVDSIKIFLLLGVSPMQVMINKYANE